MRIDYLSSDILQFRGDSLAALATAFIDGKRVLLVDALASEYDAIELRDYLERDLGLRVERIVLSHAGQGHAAGLHVFRGARIDLPGQHAGADGLIWGRHRLDFVPTPGDPARTLAIDAASAGLLFVGERVVGSIALIGQGRPEDADTALAHLQQRGAQRVVPAYLGPEHGAALGYARIYLSKLRANVTRVRARHTDSGVHAAIAAIAVEDCLAEGVHAGPLERHWHRENLIRVAERGLFPAPALQARASQDQVPRWLRGSGILSMLMCMLGRLGRSGV